MSTAPALLITTDEQLLDDLLRLAAAAGTRLDVAHDPTSALRGWPGAAAVLVGADLAGSLAGQRPPRRDEVHLVSRGPLPDHALRSALAVGARDVVELPAGETWLLELLTDVADGAAPAACTVGVVAGSGGAGATTFACALAGVAARDRPTALLDLDPLGPGVDRVVGLDDVGPDAVRWDALLTTSGRLGSRSLREALPRRDRLGVLGWAPGSPARLDPVAVREVLAAAQRGHDLVVLDLPRALDEVTEEVVARCDRVLVVADATVPGVAAAARVTARLRDLTAAVGLVVRRAGAGVPAGQVAGALGLPLVAEVSRQRRLAEDVDLGLGPVRSARSPLARAARATLLALPAGLRGAA